MGRAASLGAGLMARPTDRTRFRKDAEARFPIKVDIAVPPSSKRNYGDGATSTRFRVGLLNWCTVTAIPDLANTSKDGTRRDWGYAGQRTETGWEGWKCAQP